MEPWYGKPEWWLLILGVPTLIVVAWQAWETRKAAEATVASVNAGIDATKRELRAYISVVVGTAIHQERRERPLADLKFECRPLMVNTGQTPARKIKFRARAAVFPVPLPKEIVLPEHLDKNDEETLLGSQQNANMFGVVDGFCLDSEVDMIKDGSSDKGLYVWGLISYEDVFGEPHYTRFCQQMYWTVGGNIRGFYVPGRNDAD